SLAFQAIGDPYNNLTADGGNLTLKPDELSFVVAPTEPVRGRSCGSCTLCCKVLGVPALDTPKGAWRSRREKGVGWRIYERRPDACRSFLCGWLINPRCDAGWKAGAIEDRDRRRSRREWPRLPLRPRLSAGMAEGTLCTEKSCAWPPRRFPTMERSWSASGAK